MWQGQGLPGQARAGDRVMDTHCVSSALLYAVKVRIHLSTFSSHVCNYWCDTATPPRAQLLSRSRSRDGTWADNADLDPGFLHTCRVAWQSPWSGGHVDQSHWPWLLTLSAVFTRVGIAITVKFWDTCYGSMSWSGWPVILLSKKDTSLGLFPYFLILLWLQNQVNW